jgi:dTDP-glucose 4,6-dehydratase
MRKVLVTGGAGFIGSHFIRMLHALGDDTQIVNLDALTYAGNLANLADIASSTRYRFVHGNIRDMKVVLELVAGVDWIVNFAAESHVDRSTGPGAGAFIDTNVYGTYVLLEAMRLEAREARFLQVGSDEVYGDVPWPAFPTEDSLLKPSSPYSASKAAADQLALAFHRTHDLDILVSRCTNNYGPYQYPEKLVPLFITSALDNEPLPLYDGGTQVRDWLHVEDHCRALLQVLYWGHSGEIYNIGASQTPEVTNLELTKLILNHTNRPETLIQPVRGLRPGHDQRYAVNTSKIKALGWSPHVSLNVGLAGTVAWYDFRRDWWSPLKGMK